MEQQSAMEHQTIETDRAGGPVSRGNEPALLSAYRRQSPMTSPGRHAALLASFDASVPDLARLVQGLMLHEYAAGAYGVAIPEERTAEKHIRPLERMFDRLLALDSRPLAVARPPERRLAGVCRHYTVMLVGILRHVGIPARARCGFGSYFHSGSFEDHWVAEYWSAEASRWVRVDAQLDDTWRAMLQPDFDPMDVPHDRFIVAGDAWAACRAGGSDPSQFGIFDMRGLWFVAGNLQRDLAALNRMEMLPWDCWGPAPGPETAMTAEQYVLFDRIAAATGSSAATGEAVALYASDDRLRVPSVVFNAVLNRPEPV